METTAQPTLINLRKSVKIVLEKRSAPKIVAQVGAVFDLSGSATGLYSRGTMERVASRCFAVADTFDDNHVLDAWGFHSSLIELTPIVESMFGNYTNPHIINNNNVSKWGGTAFAPIINGVGQHYFPSSDTVRDVEVSAAVVKQPGFLGKLFGKKEEVVQAARIQRQVIPGVAGNKKLGDPAYVIIITDGENSDEGQTTRALDAYKGHDIYFQFVGISSGSRANFQFLDKVAKEYGNVGFFDADMIDNLSDDDLYSKIISTKFVNWYKKAKGL